MSDYKNQLLYTQEAMNMAKSLAKLEGQAEGFVFAGGENPDKSKIKEAAQFLHMVIQKYSDSLPHEAAIAADFLDSALKFFIDKL